jgi:hypothetical protein
MYDYSQFLRELVKINVRYMGKVFRRYPSKAERLELRALGVLKPPTQRGRFRNLYKALRSRKVCLDWPSRSAFIDWCLRQNVPANWCLLRLDPTVPYSPRNCLFVSPEVRNRSRLDNHWVEFQGQRMLFSDFVRERAVVSWPAVVDRLDHGWTLEAAALTPSRKRAKKVL